MKSDAAAVLRWRRAFPCALGGTVERVAAALPEASHQTNAHDVGAIRLRGEALQIPMRMYHEESSIPSGALSSDEARQVLSAMFSRHHDGHVRQRHLGRLLASPPPWGHPFILQLVGEYVLPIVELVGRHAAQVTGAAGWAEFIQENSAFVHLTGCRVASYWNCYYRTQFPRIQDYPGVRVLEALGAWTKGGRRRVAAG